MADRAAKAIDKAFDRNGHDSLAWANHPRSQEALGLVIDGAKSHVGLRKVLSELIEGGIAGEDGVLLRRYLGLGQWETLNVRKAAVVSFASTQEESANVEALV